MPERYYWSSTCGTCGQPFRIRIAEDWDRHYTRDTQTWNLTAPCGHDFTLKTDSNEKVTGVEPAEQPKG